MPTFVAYKDGKVVEKFTGAVPAKLDVSRSSAPSPTDGPLLTPIRP